MGLGLLGVVNPTYEPPGLRPRGRGKELALECQCTRVVIYGVVGNGEGA
jgi:hypothetical protein